MKASHYINKLFPKKFRGRVKHFAEDKYVVQYSYHRFIPTYHSLCYWFDQGVTANTYCWSTDLFGYKEAERIAEGLKSIEDVRKWHEPQEVKRKRFYEERRRFYNENVPYQTKYFKP